MSKYLILACSVLLGVNLWAQVPDTLWMRRFDNGGDEYAYGLAEDAEGNYIVTGGAEDSCLTQKWDHMGNLVWHQTYCNVVNTGVDVAVDDSNNIFVTGFRYDSSWNGTIWTVKYGPNGDTIWTRDHSVPGNDFNSGYCVSLAPDGGIVVVGSTGSSGGPFSYILIKYSSAGDTLWNRINSTGHSFSIPRDVACDGLGNIIIVGTADGPYVMKCDSVGDTLWTWHSSGDELRGVAVDADNNIFTTGWTNILLKFNPDGDIIFQQSLGGNNNWEGTSIRCSGDYLYLTGAIRIGVFSFNLLFAKYSSATGDSIWTSSWEFDASQYGWGLVVEDDGFLIAGQISNTEFGPTDVLLIKFDQEPGIQENQLLGLRAGFGLGHNYPNPFIQQTSISYTTMNAGRVSLRVYDATGRLIRTLVNADMPAGKKSVNWYGKDEYNNKVSAGIYFLRLEGDEGVAKQQIVLLQ